MKVTATTRDALAAIAQQELGGVSLEEALKVLIFEHRVMTAYARLEADPEALAEYQAESAGLAEADVDIRE
ncbi:MAG: hypothetical protein QOJ50_2578 [Cryptosporangiaceae bacterium]|nr:hypothetical protein [Cryptosporangiaceae bacterium]